MAYVELRLGGGVWVHGPAAEVRDAHADELLYDERGYCLLRWAHEDGWLWLDPVAVAGVRDEALA